MTRSQSTSRSKLFALILFIFLFSTTTLVFSETEDSDDDLQDIEELIAIDEEQEGSVDSSQHPNTHYESGKKSEAEVWSKARGIVVELNSDSAKRVVDENEYVMVLGYAPWCSRSADLMPKFAQAANVLKGLRSDVLMAKIDTDRHPKPASGLGIKGVPSLVLFTNGTSRAYTGGFSSEELVVWIRKKTGTPVIKISSANEANEFLNQHSTYAVGLFDKFEGPDYEEFVKAAAEDNEFQFVETKTEDIAKLLYPVGKPTFPFFGLVKNEPEFYTSLDDKITLDNIIRFLDTNKFPLVTLMTELNSARVYSSQKKLQVYVFVDADDIKKLLEPLREVAKNFISEVLIVAVDIAEENLAKPFLTLFGLEDSEETTVVAFDYKTNSKYVLESDPTSRNIEDFCAGLVKQTLTPYYKSQPIPDNKNSSILTIVGKTFDDLVLRNTNNVLLEVHTPWCMTCETTSKQVEKLAKHFKGLDSLVFARIDASANEHPKLQAEEFPTLLFFPANDKSNPITLPTKSSLKDLAALINKNLKTQDDSSPTRDEL